MYSVAIIDDVAEEAREIHDLPQESPFHKALDVKAFDDVKALIDRVGARHKPLPSDSSSTPRLLPMTRRPTRCLSNHAGTAE